MGQFYAPGTGFTSLISIGDAINDRQVTQLRDVPHYIHEGSSGYDGAYYVQISLNPTLQNPELPRVIDNLQYRARRILFSWVAWLGGLGRPEWVVQSHALLNVVCWFALGWVLLRWFPPTSWENFIRWFSLMFSHGLCMSVRNALVDGPALLLVALALAAWEDGRVKRATVLLMLTGLGRESSLLAASACAPGQLRDRAAWWRWIRLGVIAALPLLIWAVYLRVKFGPLTESGLNNFTLPLAGFAEKWGVTIANLAGRGGDRTLCWITLADIFALAVQAMFFALRWRPTDPWWRVGATFVGLMVFLATPVWEGFPGAAGRALLPMTLAFNVLVPRGPRWLPVLIAGNLTVLAAFTEFSPPQEFFTVNAPRAVANSVTVDPVGGWFSVESSAGLKWRWSSGKSGLRIRNDSGRPLAMVCAGRAGPADDDRRLRISVGEAMAWSGQLAVKPVGFEFCATVPPGESILSFTTDKPAHPIGGDSRNMAFRIFDLTIAVKATDAR